jgi:hypothetical protein
MLQNSLPPACPFRAGGIAQLRLESAERLVAGAFDLVAQNCGGISGAAQELHLIVTALKLRRELAKAIGQKEAA